MAKNAFEVASVFATQKVVNTAGAAAEDLRGQIDLYVKQYTKAFYFQMFVYLNRFAAATYSGSPLSEGYEDKKQQRGLPLPSFYRFTGGLKTELRRRNPSRDLGQAKVTFGTRGGTLKKGIKRDSRGIPQFKAGSGGRGFASISQAFKSVNFDITIEMYSSIKGGNYDQVFAKYNQKLRMKFASQEFGTKKASGSIPARPLLVPFARWYGTTRLRTGLKQKFPTINVRKL
jgi:hypothetical protein